MISFLALLFPVISSQSTPLCSDESGTECYNQLLQLQSSQACGNASLITSMSMGHKMPKDASWMSCACDKLPDIVDCLEKSTCDAHQQMAEDFSGVVGHCGMSHMDHGPSTISSTSASPTASASSNAGFGLNSPGLNSGLCALCILALA